jgi:hypothetical protein
MMRKVVRVRPQRVGVTVSVLRETHAVTVVLQTAARVRFSLFVVGLK